MMGEKGTGMWIKTGKEKNEEKGKEKEGVEKRG